MPKASSLFRAPWIAFLALLLSACGSPREAEAELKVQWTEPPQGLEELVTFLRDTGEMEAAVAYVGASIRLPREVSIVFQTCEVPNAFYDPNTKRVLMCYELVALFDEIFTHELDLTDEEIDDAIIGSTLFFLLHEVGHALVDVLDLPITGKEEDAVDDLAAILMIDAEAHEDVLSAADGFELLAYALEDTGAELPMWDEHSLDGQRAYSLTCLVYGSAPQDFEDLVEEEYLPEERAVRCPEEYAQKVDAWERLTAAHARD